LTLQKKFKLSFDASQLRSLT